MAKNQFVRKPACKTTIGILLHSELVEGNQEEGDHILTAVGEKIFRHNVVAIILQKETVGSVTNFLVEDGTGNITARFFEKSPVIESLDVGNVVILVGKIRMYNQERYISPEIVKKIDAKWMKVRSLELKNVMTPTVSLNEKKENDVSVPIEKESEEVKVPPIINQEEKVEITQIDEENVQLPFEKITALITELDDGSGVLMETIIEKSPLRETEDILTKMLEKGDVFQITPGKIKVL